MIYYSPVTNKIILITEEDFKVTWVFDGKRAKYGKLPILETLMSELEYTCIGFL